MFYNNSIARLLINSVFASIGISIFVYWVYISGIYEWDTFALRHSFADIVSIIAFSPIIFVLFKIQLFVSTWFMKKVGKENVTFLKKNKEKIRKIKTYNKPSHGRYKDIGKIYVIENSQERALAALKIKALMLGADGILVKKAYTKNKHNFIDFLKMTTGMLFNPENLGAEAFGENEENKELYYMRGLAQKKKETFVQKASNMSFSFGG